MDTGENDQDEDNDITSPRLKAQIPKQKPKSKHAKKRSTRNPETSSFLAPNEEPAQNPQQNSSRNSRHPRPNTLVPPGQCLGKPNQIISQNGGVINLPRAMQGKHGRKTIMSNRPRDMANDDNANLQAKLPELSSSSEAGKKGNLYNAHRSLEDDSSEINQSTTTQETIPEPSSSRDVENRHSRKGKKHPNKHLLGQHNVSDGRIDHHRMSPGPITLPDNGSTGNRNVSHSVNLEHCPSATVVIAESESDIDSPRGICTDVATEITPRVESQHLNADSGDRPSRHQPNEPHVVQLGAEAAISPLSDDTDNLPAPDKRLLSVGARTNSINIYDEPPPAYSTVDRRYDIVPGPNYGYLGQSVMFTDPPPSYRDLFQESVRQTVTRLSSSNGRSGFLSQSTCAHVCCTAFFVVILIGFAIVLPIAMIGVGVHHLYDCPAEPRIPIYLIVAAIFQMIECCGRLTYYAQEHRNPSNRRRHRDPCIYFVLIWFVIGSIWVYQTSPVFIDQQTVYVHNSTAELAKIVPTVAPTHKEGNTAVMNDYCDRTLYFFAFWLVTIYYLAIGFFFTMIIISIFVHTMVTFCRRFANISQRAGGERV